MSNPFSITVTGNVVADPELNRTQDGTLVANFRIAHQESLYDRETNEFRDGPASFLRVARFGKDAQYVYDSLRKGMRVTVVGKLLLREYEHEGAKGLSPDIRAEEVAVNLRFGATTFRRGGLASNPASQQERQAEAEQYEQEQAAPAPAPAPAQAASKPAGTRQRASRASSATAKATAQAAPAAAGAGLGGLFD